MRIGEKIWKLGVEVFLNFRRVPQRTLGQSVTLPSAAFLALGKAMSLPSVSKGRPRVLVSHGKKTFAECLTLNTQQNPTEKFFSRVPHP